MKIGIIGSGETARTMANGLIKYGHDVMVSTRTPSKLTEWGTKNPMVRIGSFEDAAKFSGLAVLAVKGLAAVDAIRIAGPDNLFGKPVIDITNPLADLPPINGVLSYFTNYEESLMERLQAEFPKILFVKAFNSIGSNLWVNPQFKGGPPTMFICGNDNMAKNLVRGILDQFGWEAADMGKVEAARAIEPLCILWCIPGFLENDWNHVYKVLK